MNSRNVGIAWLSNRAHHELNILHQLLEFPGFSVQLFAAFRGEPVKAGFAVVFRCAPVRLQPAFDEKAIQGGVERAVFDCETVVRGVFDALGDGVTVEGASRERLEDEQEERARQELRVVFGHVFFPRRFRSGECATPVEARYSSERGVWQGDLCPAARRASTTAKSDAEFVAGIAVWAGTSKEPAETPAVRGCCATGILASSVSGNRLCRWGLFLLRIRIRRFFGWLVDFLLDRGLPRLVRHVLGQFGIWRLGLDFDRTRLC